jgi:hypothetical protein
MLPMKWTKGWAWENTWLVFAATAYLICPWLFVFIDSARSGCHLRRRDRRSTCGRYRDGGAVWCRCTHIRLRRRCSGVSIGFAVILGGHPAAARLYPFFCWVKHSGGSLIVTSAALVVMLFGVAVCSYAGRWKYRVRPWRADRCAGQNAGRRSKLRTKCSPGAADRSLFLCNATYALRRLIVSNALMQFRSERPAINLACGGTMGTLWMLGFVSFYDSGTTRVGPLASSYGWPAMMSTMVLTANLLGLATGEWKDAPPSSSDSESCWRLVRSWVCESTQSAVTESSCHAGLRADCACASVRCTLRRHRTEPMERL